MKRTLLTNKALIGLTLAVALCTSLLLLKTPSPSHAPSEPPRNSLGEQAVGLASSGTAEWQGEESLRSPRQQSGAGNSSAIQRVQAANAGGGTQVYTTLTTVENEAGYPPANCEGWTVWATTVDRRSGERSSFSALSNAQGIAEFVFPEPIQLIRVSCVPPLASGFGVANHDDFVELERGENFEALLYFRQAFAVSGRVIDLDGEPVAGATVHAFLSERRASLADWRPGLLTTTTAEDGGFGFAQMYQDDWVVAVEPRTWLMMDPTLGEQSESKGAVSFFDPPQLQQPDRWDCGTLQVMPIQRTLLTVRDRNQQPAIGLFGYARPLLLNEPRLTPTPSEQKTRKRIPAAMRNFLNVGASQDASPNALEVPSDFGHVDGWPYAEVWFRTNRKGQAQLPLPDGKWQLKLFPPDSFLRKNPFPPLEFRTGSGSLDYQLPAAIGAIRGHLVFADGTPAKYADVFLRATRRDESGTGFGAGAGAESGTGFGAGAGAESGTGAGAGGGSRTRVDIRTMASKDGYFEFPALEIGARFTVRAVPDKRYCNFIATEWPLQVQASAPPLAQAAAKDFVVAAGLKTSVNFSAPGFDLNAHPLRLHANHWQAAAASASAMVAGSSTKATSADSADLAWWTVVQSKDVPISGRLVELPSMPAGQVEYLVMVDVGTGTWLQNGMPRTKLVEWSRVVLEVGALYQEVSLDLEGYQVPQAALAHHHGVVLDQNSGQPIADAQVFLWRENQFGDSRSQTTHGAGAFHFSNGSGAYLLMASAAGYAPREVPLRNYPAGTYEHRILLEPLQYRFSLTLVDREGRPLPDCTVTFPDADGHNTAVFEQGGFFARDSFFLRTGTGGLDLVGLEPGPDVLRVDFWGAVTYDLGFGAPNEEGQEVKVALPVSLEELREALRAGL